MVSSPLHVLVVNYYPVDITKKLHICNGYWTLIYVIPVYPVICDSIIFTKLVIFMQTGTRLVTFESTVTIFHGRSQAGFQPPGKPQVHESAYRKVQMAHMNRLPNPICKVSIQPNPI